MEQILKKIFVATICISFLTVFNYEGTDVFGAGLHPSTTFNSNKENSPYDYTLVWMSDTQYYSKNYPHIYKSMVDWIAANKDYLNIPYVFHTGDVVNEWDNEAQWQYADTYMKVLEKVNIPYGILAGNHDIDLKSSNKYTQFSKYFGQTRFEKQPSYGGSYKDNQGHFDLISENSDDYIMVYMGWGISKDEIDWINRVLAKYPDHIALLSFHDYLLASGKHSPIGEEIFKKVVEPNKNVVATLSGHYYGSETRIEELDDNKDGKPDRKVYQMMTNYQNEPEGGQGYMRLLKVKSNENKIYVKTYSSYLNSYKYATPQSSPGKDEIVIELPD
ncbi:Calcineurin-like phosphoesterase [Halobacillus alkaliphilus]|uniref:Calcineurin-like phosphoesterase n=1 Tax=Halobacillus alkaliphilus TaxID=396056 RepID=A0A1I2LMF0_9BACI|nr:metallophosphoesterase [Halobacillus alkaliphilus]SFF80435.1 Calcineurin-like phosphoesterase [Halobacillus alkaliphilus]